jgi:nucleoside-triphosphatase THEP1
MSYSFNEEVQDRIEHNKNALICVQGETGSGKSYLSLSLAEQLDPKFTIERVCFSYKEFMELVQVGRFEKGSVIVIDEAGALLFSRNFNTIINKTIAIILQTFRQDNLIVFFNVPSIKFVDKVARSLFHYYIEPVGINREENICYAKIKRVFNVQTQEDALTIFPRYIEDDEVKIVSTINVRKPTAVLVHAYENKKREYRAGLVRNYLSEITDLEQAEQPKEEKEVEYVKKILDRIDDLGIVRNGKFTLSEYKVAGLLDISINKARILSQKVGLMLISQQKPPNATVSLDSP